MSRVHPKIGSNISPRWRESRPKSHSPEHPKTMDFECSKSCPSPNSEDVWMTVVFTFERAADDGLTSGLCAFPVNLTRSGLLRTNTGAPSDRVLLDRNDPAAWARPNVA